MDEIRIPFSGGRSTRVLVGRAAIEELASRWSPAWEEAAVIGDRSVVRLYGDRIRASLAGRTRRVTIVDFEPGEAHKTRAEKERIEDRLLDLGIGRGACVVALGGGVSLDLAGFVAATFQRGMPWVGVPTSLLAQVDASIGGKTGVDTRHGKNTVGVFHQPDLVLVDPDLLGTLPAAEWPNGLSEMLKHAVVADADLADWLEHNAMSIRVPGDIDPWPVGRCIHIKAAVVAEDETEQGRRAVLNFGHTVGHAVERASSYAVPHGEAVAMGMRIEARVAMRLTGFSEADFKRLLDLLVSLGLGPTPLPSFADVTPYFEADKKRRVGVIRMALPTVFGTMARDGDAWTLPVSLEEIREAWDHDMR